VIISVRLKDDAGAAVKVKFSRADETAAIREVILLNLGLAPISVFKLVDEEGVGVAVTANLQPGEYTVVVLSAQ
jgi:hypothetical protein